MKASLRALLTGVIDYAGLFPPAKLGMAEAVANYLRYREGEDAWMLGRFICPASRLKEIPEGVTLSCSATGRGGATAEGFLDGLQEDLADVTVSRVKVDVLEVKLPPDHEDYPHLVEETRRRVAHCGLSVFFEVSWANFEGLLALLAALPERGFAGYKLRTGGTEASAFPPAEPLGLALQTGIEFRRCAKVTAGLHHPLPRWDEGAQARMHGFVNVFVAAAMIQVHDLTVDGVPSLVELLEEADARQFEFTDEGLRWRDLRVSVKEIEEARRTGLLSFGSCSFDEPREDLRALGWM